MSEFWYGVLWGVGGTFIFSGLICMLTAPLLARARRNTFDVAKYDAAPIFGNDSFSLLNHGKVIGWAINEELARHIVRLLNDNS